VRRPKKIVLVTIILLAGAALAWQFRRTASGHNDAGPSDGTQAAARADSAAGAVLAGRIEFAEPTTNSSTANLSDRAPLANEAVSHGDRQALSPAVTVATVESAGVSEPPPARSPIASGPPEFSRSFSGTGTLVGSSVAEAPNTQATTPAIRDLGPDGPEAGETAGVSHTIVDGDTLAKLAQKYLGSANRAGELFAYNRDVLSDPELLPIGGELRIPNDPTSRSAPTTIGQTVGRQVSQTVNAPAAIPTGDSASQLVPVPGAVADLKPNAEPPKLIPLPPTHLAAVPIDHSYVVQPGDTLWAIAQRLYGDGRRSDVLLQANRDRLWNPKDLRPGMTLVVP
jgi:nucleoid-associated protein YgaU